jgi:hypothetical protein
MAKTVGRQAYKSRQSARSQTRQRGRRVRPPGISLTNILAYIGALGVIVDITTNQAIIEMIQLLVGIWT